MTNARKMRKKMACLTVAAALIALPITGGLGLFTSDAAFAAKGGNGNGNCGGHGNGNGNGNGNGGATGGTGGGKSATAGSSGKSASSSAASAAATGAAAVSPSDLGALNAINASPEAFANASPKSRIGRIKAYAEASVQAAQAEAATRSL